MMTDQLPPRVSANESATPIRVVPAPHLFAGDKEIHILHEGETYRLRITRNNKLILTK